MGEVTHAFREQGLDEMVIEKLELECGEKDMAEWDEFVGHSASLSAEVDIALQRP